MLCDNGRVIYSQRLVGYDSPGRAARLTVDDGSLSIMRGGGRKVALPPVTIARVDKFELGDVCVLEPADVLPEGTRVRFLFQELPPGLNAPLVEIRNELGKPVWSGGAQAPSLQVVLPAGQYSVHPYYRYGWTKWPFTFHPVDFHVREDVGQVVKLALDQPIVLVSLKPSDQHGNPMRHGKWVWESGNTLLWSANRNPLIVVPSESPVLSGEFLVKDPDKNGVIVVPVSEPGLDAGQINEINIELPLPKED